MKTFKLFTSSLWLRWGIRTYTPPTRNDLNHGWYCQQHKIKAFKTTLQSDSPRSAQTWIQFWKRFHLAWQLPKLRSDHRPTFTKSLYIYVHTYIYTQFFSLHQSCDNEPLHTHTHRAKRKEMQANLHKPFCTQYIIVACFWPVLVGYWDNSLSSLVMKDKLLF